MRKNFIIERIKKRDEEKMYVFFNLTKNQGIKKMRPKSGESDIRIGEIVKMDGYKYQLDVIFDFKNGELISWIGG
jgi:hypothetical protein